MRQQAFTRAVSRAALIMRAAVAASAQLPEKVGNTPVPSLAPIIKKTSPAVVNIATKGTMREQRPRNPLLEDPFFRRFFDAPGCGAARTSVSERRLGRDRRCEERLHHHERTRDRERRRNHGDAARRSRGQSRDRRPRQALGRGGVESDGEEPRRHAARGFQQGRSRRLRDRDRQSVRAQHTVTSGIISALGRSDINPEAIEDFIQTDASINPGNSGGALVNLRGAARRREHARSSRGSGGNIGIGFAIPSNMVQGRDDAAHAVRRSEARHARRAARESVHARDRREPRTRQRAGALVSQVVEGSPADKAGIKAGDVITSINGRTVANASELRNTIGLLRIGEKVEMALMREGKPRRVTAMIGERDGADADRRRRRFIRHSKAQR